MYDDQVTEIWKKYQDIKDQHDKTSLNSKTEKCYDFYNGRQWRGISKVNEEELVSMNIIKPIVKYKSASVAQQEMSITYSPMNKENAVHYQNVCERLNEFANQQWEKQKMYTKLWGIIQDASIVGDSYIFFYDGELNSQVIDNTNIFLANEQEQDIQKQPYIIIYERRTVDEVKADAEKNGLSEEEISSIVSDDDTDNLNDEAKKEVSNNSKCTCLLMLTKKDGIVTIERSTKNVIYQKETQIFSESEDGKHSVALKLYPIASFIWQKKKGSARGIGEVEQLIPNQIAINKNLVRIEEAVKLFAFPRLAYNRNKINNVQDIDKVGAAIEVDDKTVTSVKDVVDYLAPQQLSTDAYKLGDELKNSTMDLAGAGDSALGNIDPTKASGTAIIAVKDQSAIPLNEQIATEKQTIEDIALIWYQLWIVYNPNGIEIPTGEYDNNGNAITETITNDEMQAMEVDIKIDIAPNNPYSKYAQQQALDKLFEMQILTFEEYVEALDDNASVPKSKLQNIIADRKANITNEIDQLMAQKEQLTQQVLQLQPQQPQIM